MFTIINLFSSALKTYKGMCEGDIKTNRPQTAPPGFEIPGSATVVTLNEWFNSSYTCILKIIQEVIRAKFTGLLRTLLLFCCKSTSFWKNYFPFSFNQTLGCLRKTPTLSSEFHGDSRVSCWTRLIKLRKSIFFKLPDKPGVFRRNRIKN